MRLGSVYMLMTRFLTVAESSLSRIALPRLLLILAWPSVPTSVAADDIGVRQGEDLAVGIVETAGDLAADLDVGFVVLAHRHKMGARHQYVRRLQHRIAEQVVGHLLHAGRRGHILDGGQLLQALNRHHAAEDQVHFVDLMHRRLQIEGRPCRIDADRQVIENDLAGVLADLRDVLLGPVLWSACAGRR